MLPRSNIMEILRVSTDKTVWFQKLAAQMVRTGHNLNKVQHDLNLEMTSRECENLAVDKEFVACLRGERHRYYKEIATDPTRSKTTKIGQMEILALKLEEEGFLEKAAKVHLDISKLEGWLDSQTQVNVFGDLSAADLQKMRERVKAAGDIIN
jgi:hypothetical protein